jgi:8-oxo-dGTP pyrophosphatase MutT (NUDIX family)
MKQKREVAALLPYRKTSNGLEFFLQQRDMKTHVNAGLLDLFGGGLEEGETTEQALSREIQEELEYVPKTTIYFSRYENATHICHVFLEEVGAEFESSVQVHEGKYGKFLTLEEAQMSKIFAQTLLVLQQVSQIFGRG